ncbi:hypothetical protein SLS62_004223 [Diatrype stigma]|uniref:DUF2293 domain-containing protein n=1 Tax=Diatrype stigma TaxID=117547 RepID=A0AAN9YTD4_9PEZI
MAREKKKAPAPQKGSQASTLARRTKRDRAQQYNDHIWQNLNPLKEPPKVKHKTYFESVENTDRKKKKLEYKCAVLIVSQQITTDRIPPPGFEFIATGNPDLTTACKELSREQDALIFIVSRQLTRFKDAKNPSLLEHHMNRVGYHFRQMIVEQARATLVQNGKYHLATQAPRRGEPEPIPQDQRDINRQADDVLRDLFPRIPNIDRQEIIQHAFKKDGKFHGDYKVGMAKDLTLARRVQLAALAYIRHTKTRYDELLRETDWANARKAVEKPCLDTIVKWRGDEETGRDQLDEILREVIEISDSEEDSGDETSSPESASAQDARAMSSTAPANNLITPRSVPMSFGPTSPQGHRVVLAQGGLSTPARQKGMTRMERRTARKAAQRFRRYAAVADSIAHEHGQDGHISDTASRLPTTVVDLTSSPTSHHPVRSIKEALPVAYRMRSPGHVASRAQLAPQPGRFTPAMPGEVISRRSHVISEDRRRPASPALIRVSEGQRPKVGQLFAQQDHTPAAVSPRPTGFQDMLLPSIEPKSPHVPEYPQYANRTLHREYQDRAVPPRMISYPDQPGDYASRPHSRPFGPDGDERAVKRRVTTYFPEDYNRPSNPLPPSSSFVSMGHAKPGEGARFVPLAYSSSGAPVVRRSENARPEQPVVISTREYLPRDREEAPIRTRTNPIMVENDSPYRPQRLFEVRDRSIRERLDPDAARRQEVVYEPSSAPSRIYPVQRACHDERAISNYRHDNAARNYVEPASRRLQDTILPPSASFPTEPHRENIRVQPNYPRLQYRELPQDHRYLRQPLENCGNIHREVQNVPRSPGRFEM